MIQEVTCYGCHQKNVVDAQIRINMSLNDFHHSINFFKKDKISYGDGTYIEGTIYSDCISLNPGQSFTVRNF